MESRGWAAEVALRCWAASRTGVGIGSASVVAIQCWKLMCLDGL